MHGANLIKKNPKYYLEPIPVPVRSKASVCGRLSDGIASSNTVEGIRSYLLFVVRCVGSGLCDGLITRLGESYRVSVCVCLCVCVVCVCVVCVCGAVWCVCGVCGMVCGVRCVSGLCAWW